MSVKPAIFLKLQVCALITTPLLRPNFGSVPIGPDRPCWGQSEHKP